MCVNYEIIPKKPYLPQIPSHLCVREQRIPSDRHLFFSRMLTFATIVNQCNYGQIQTRLVKTQRRIADGR